MDFNFYIQNFSAISYNKLIAPEQDATFHYSFIPSESFASRPFGLNINLVYHDIKGNVFQDAVFNETVQIVELEEGKLAYITVYSLNDYIYGAVLNHLIHRNIILYIEITHKLKYLMQFWFDTLSIRDSLNSAGS